MTQLTNTAATTTDNADDLMLANLFDDLEMVEDAEVEIEAAAEDELDSITDDLGAVEASADIALDDDLLDDVVASAELDTNRAKLYAEQPADTDDGSAPTTTPEDAAKPKKAKAPKEPKEPKAPRATSVTHKPGDLLKLKLGAKANEFLVFSMNDAETLTPEELAAKADAFIERMNDRDLVATKVREKAIMFFGWLATGGNLNEVIRRTLTVLHSQGELTSGDKGNLQLDLLEKPYSNGTARSQSNQMFMMFPELGMTMKEKGKMVANPDSPLLALAFANLGL